MNAGLLVRLLVLTVVGVSGIAVAACADDTSEVRDGGAAATNAAPVREVPPETVTIVSEGETQTVQIEPETVTVETTVESEPETAPPPVEPEGEVDAGLVWQLRYDRPEPVEVTFDPTTDPARASVEALLAGPTPAQKALRYDTAVPEGTQLVGFDVSDGVATVSLSGAFDDEGPETPLGPSSVVAIYQLVYTLTQWPEVREVRLLVDGQPYGPGGITDEPLTREFVDQILSDVTTPALTCDPDPEAVSAMPTGRPMVLVTPVNDASLPAGQPLVFTGLLRSGADVIVARVIQYMHEVRHAVSNSGCSGRFSWEIDLPPSLTGPITLEVFVPGEDGTKRGQALRRLVVE